MKEDKAKLEIAGACRDCSEWSPDEEGEPKFAWLGRCGKCQVHERQTAESDACLQWAKKAGAEEK